MNCIGRRRSGAARGRVGCSPRWDRRRALRCCPCRTTRQVPLPDSPRAVVRADLCVAVRPPRRPPHRPLPVLASSAQPHVEVGGLKRRGSLASGGAAARAGRWLISRWVWRRSLRCRPCRITRRVLLPRSPSRRHCPRRPPRFRPPSTLSSTPSPVPSWLRQQISVSNLEG